MAPPIRGAIQLPQMDPVVYGAAIMGIQIWKCLVVLASLLAVTMSAIVHAQIEPVEDSGVERASTPAEPITYPGVTTPEATSSAATTTSTTTEYSPVSDEPPSTESLCPEKERRSCVHVDAGLHGYLVSDTRLFGLHFGIGYEWFSFRGMFGAIINNGVNDRFGTSLLGPYFGGLASIYFLRLERFEARAGLGVNAYWLGEISSELTYVAGIVSMAGSWYFLDYLGAFVDLQVMPLSSKGLTLGYFPGMLQVGLEITL